MHCVWRQHCPFWCCVLLSAVSSLPKCTTYQRGIKTECTMPIVAEIYLGPLSKNLVFRNPTTPTDGRVSVFCWTVRRRRPIALLLILLATNVATFEVPNANAVIRTSPTRGKQVAPACDSGIFQQSCLTKFDKGSDANERLNGLPPILAANL